MMKARKSVMSKKIKIWVFTLSLLSSLFFSHLVYGAEHFSFKDDFTDYDETTYTGLNVNMEDNWRTANNAEVAEKYSTVPIGYGNGCLKINTNTNTVGEKYTTSRAKNCPTAILTAERNNLTASQKISVKAKRIKMIFERIKATYLDYLHNRIFPKFKEKLF